jgi:hypothetical protein
MSSGRIFGGVVVQAECQKQTNPMPEPLLIPNAENLQRILADGNFNQLIGWPEGEIEMWFWNPRRGSSSLMLLMT